MISRKVPPFCRILTRSLLMIALGIVIQLASAFFLTAILRSFPALQSDYSELLSRLKTPGLLRILYVAFLAPIAEEMIFRYGLLRLGERFLPFFLANLIQAVLFGFYHGNPVQIVYASLLGLLFGFLVRKTGNVWYVILLHVTINVTGLLL